MRISDWSSDVCSSDLHCDSPSHLRDLSPDGEPRMSSVCWVVSDIVEETARLAGHQCPVVMQGNIFDETFRTTWFDTSAMLGCYAEVFIEHLTLRMSLARCRERSEARREGKECVSTCRYRWSTVP